MEPAGSILDGMTSLVDKSLVRQEGETEPRFTMLETIREYAGERLVAMGFPLHQELTVTSGIASSIRAGAVSKDNRGWKPPFQAVFGTPR